jgi:tetratricopeptide (TPR) repeat protein
LALIAYLFVASVDFPLERNEHQFVLAIILCIILGSNRNEEKQSSLNKNLLLISITFLLVFSTVYSLLRLPNEQHAKKMVQAHMNSNWERILKEAKQINPNLFTIDNFSIPIAWYQGLAHYSMGNKEKAKESFTEAYQINPYQVHVLNNMAGMFEQEGKHTQALVYYDKLLAISPKQPDALLNKSAVLYNEKRYDEAMACIYKLKYDEKNDQFLLYLNAIGKAYLEKKLHESPDIPMEAKENKEYIKNFFIINQKMNRTFDELQIIPYE